MSDGTTSLVATSLGAVRNRVARSRIGDVVRAARSGAPVPQQQRRPRQPVGIDGMVEQFSRRLVVGWLSMPADHPPVEVTLHLDDVLVASTYANPDAAMSGRGSATRGGELVASTARKPKPVRQPRLHAWQLPDVPGPADDRRNSNRQVRTFSFRVRDIWEFCRRTTRVTVRVDGRPLPIYGHGMFLSPRRHGASSLADLREKLDSGFVFSHYGTLQLTKQLDTEWQSTVMSLYAKTRAILSETHGYDVFFVYGTLLGAVREGTFIGHDNDFDCAYVSKHTDPDAVRQEFLDLALLLIERGLDVEAMNSTLHVVDPAAPGARIDVFHTYFDAEGRLSFPFGVAGTSTFTRDDWQGTEEIELGGGRGLVPVDAEKLVEHLYGADWRVPKKGFNWNIDRTSFAEGRLTPAQRSKVYWTNFYAHTEYTSGSTFFEFVDARPDTPGSVIDIGCGDGRDACAFGASGRRVVGLDQSPVGIEHATGHAAAIGLSDRVSFRTCDVADHDALTAVIHDAVAASGEAPAAVLPALLPALDPRGRPGRPDGHHRPARAAGRHARRGVPDREGRGGRPRCTASTTAASRTAPPSAPCSPTGSASPCSTRRRAPASRRTRARTRSSTAWWPGAERRAECRRARGTTGRQHRHSDETAGRQ